MKITIGVLISVFAILALVLGGCTSSATSSIASGNTGKIEVRVTDAPPDKEITAIKVTVDNVEIHLGIDEANQEQETEQEQENGNGQNQNNNQNQNQNQTTTTTNTTTAEDPEDNSGWMDIALSGSNTFDLLQIQGLEQVLAVGDLAAGTYTQIRFEVSKVEVTFAGEAPVTARIPSGKLKFVRPFTIVAGETTVLLFDFDAAKSVNITGKDIIFKPVIKLSVTEKPGTLEITTPSLPNGGVGTAYNASLAAMGGKTPYTWTTTSTIPGLTLSSAGVLSGTPTTAGDYILEAKVTDSAATPKTATKSYTISIAAQGVLQITTTGLPDGMVGTAYNATVQAIGGTLPYVWSIPAANLPAGLTLNAATGEITGTPTVAGDTTITVFVTDSASPAAVDTQALTIHIAEAPATD